MRYMENSVDCITIRQNSPDRDFGTKSNKINQNLCKLLIGFVFAILFASFIASAQSSFYGTTIREVRDLQLIRVISGIIIRARR